MSVSYDLSGFFYLEFPNRPQQLRMLSFEFSYLTHWTGVGLELGCLLYCAVLTLDLNGTAGTAQFRERFPWPDPETNYAGTYVAQGNIEEVAPVPLPPPSPCSVPVSRGWV